MGGSCSMQRQRNSSSSSSRNDRSRCLPSDRSNSSKSSKRLCSRHSVVSAVPDDFISNLYPVENNYIIEDDTGLRTPKTLSDLCTNTLCRCLPYLDGALPSGLPQDIVDDVTASLVKHSALNATTLSVLKHCELGSLTLSGCRGVTDAWLEPLSCSVSTPPTNDSSSSRCGSPEIVLSSPSLDPMMSSDHHINCGDRIEAIDLDNGYKDRDTTDSTEVFYNATKFGEHEASSHDSNSTTSSFVSASSTRYTASTSVAPRAVLSLSRSNESSMITSKKENQIEINNNNSTNSKCNQKDERDSSSICFNEDYDEYKSNCIFNKSKLPSIQFPQPVMITTSTSHITLLDLRGSQRLTDKGLLQLSNLSSLEIAKLDNCHSIQGRGLIALSRSHRLHTLSLANCRRLSDEAVINISHLISLEALSLDGCRCLTDRSVFAIGKLTSIKMLDLSQCDLITDAGLQELQQCHIVEELSLGWCRAITDGGIEMLVNHQGRSENVRILSLARIPITDTGIKHLSSLSALEELDLNGCSNIGSVSLGNTLEKLAKLERLDVSYCPGILRSTWQGKINALKTLDACYSAVKDSHISRLTDLPSLEEINLDSCPVGDWSVINLESSAPNLISFDLADTDLSDSGMIHLAKFQKLRRLSLFYCNLTNSSLRHLASLKNLEVLNLDSREIGDSGLFHLRSLQNLKSLDIFSGRVTDHGCSHIAKIKSLESLELCGGGITDTGCSTLATLENLVSLNLSQNERITNRGAAALAALSKLKTLNLSNTRVDSEALIHFSDLMNLKSLALYGCQGMKERKNSMLDRLENELPNLKCIRLNNGSDNDGVLSNRDGDTDDEDEISKADQIVINESNSRRLQSSEDEDHDIESQSDSSNEMVDAHAAFDSESNDNDEEGFESDSTLSEEL